MVASSSRLNKRRHGQHGTVLTFFSSFHRIIAAQCTKTCFWRDSLRGEPKQSSCQGKGGEGQQVEGPGVGQMGIRGLQSSHLNQM